MIHLEGINDETLIGVVGWSRHQALQHSSKAAVIVSTYSYWHEHELGIMDEDPGCAPHPLLGDFAPVCEEPDLGLRLIRQHQQRNHLIEIQPDLEPWLYQLGKAVGIKPTDHSLPESHKGLHQEAKKHRKHLIAYLTACTKAGSPHLAKLAEWLRLA